MVESSEILRNQGFFTYLDTARQVNGRLGHISPVSKKKTPSKAQIPLFHLYLACSQTDQSCYAKVVDPYPGTRI
jgi:hypothetical protein